MIRVNTGNNIDRTGMKAFSLDDTLAKVISDSGIPFTGGAFHLNGMSVLASEMGKTFREFGIADGTDNFLVNVIKADNA